MIFRPVERSDLERLKPLLVSDPASALIADRFLVRFEAGEYRPAWTWIAEESPDAEPAAAVIWWGTAQENLPAALDGLFAGDVPGSGQMAAAAGAGAAADAWAAGADDRVALAADLLTAAHQAFADAGPDRPPDFHIFLPPDWRDRQDVTAASNWRLEAARRAGLTSMLERLRYEWAPVAVVPAQRGHGLAAEILAEITRILVAEAGATTIHADTDLENRPMAAAFEQVGYRPAGRRLVLSAS